MSIAEKIEERVNDAESLSRIDVLLKRLERFDAITPDETVWSEKRLLDTVRTHIQNQNDS